MTLFTSRRCATWRAFRSTFSTPATGPLGAEIRDFLAASRQTVALFDRVILASLEKNRGGLTMKELIDAVAEAVGDWPQDTWTLAMFPVKGHMDRLEELGKVRALRATRPVKWQLV